MIRLLGKFSVLTLSQGVNLFLSLIITILLTKNLGLSEFGIYTFYLICLYMLSMVIDLGLNEAGAQDLAEIRDPAIIRRRIGNIFFLGGIICILYSLSVLVISLFIDTLFRVQAGDMFRSTWWILFSVPLYELSKAVCRGSGYLNRWSLINILPRFLFLISIFYLLKFGQLDLISVCRFFAFSYLISGVINFFLIQPVFNIDISILKHLITKVRSFGFNVMIGVSIFNLTVYFDRLFISLMLSSDILAIYQVAVAFANPIVMFSRSIGISTFKYAVDESIISRQLNYLNFFVLVLQAVIVFIVTPYVLDFFSLENYQPLLSILPLILIAHLFLGMKQPYGFYFIAKKEGRLLKKIALITAVISVTAFLLFIWKFNLYGAAIALIVTYAVLFVIHVYYAHRIKM